VSDGEGFWFDKILEWDSSSELKEEFSKVEEYLEFIKNSKN